MENKARVGGEVIKMKDHSVFIAFAPMDDPKIAIAVFIENAGGWKRVLRRLSSSMTENVFGSLLKNEEDRLF